MAPQTQPGQQPERQPPEAAPAVRASSEERDAAVRRLQMAFADERLDDEEFEQRVRAALSARTHAELDRLLADLPAAVTDRAAVDARPTHKLTLAIKASTRRHGRWRVPERPTAVAYKGSCRLDLRAAELTANVTMVRAIAYKSTVEIVVPPGVRVDASGLGLTGGRIDSDADDDPPPDAPVVRVRGLAYKGHVAVRIRPAEGGPETGS